MDIGTIGLGRMGANMAVRLTRDGHRVVALDLSAEARRGAAAEGMQAYAKGYELIQHKEESKLDRTVSARAPSRPSGTSSSPRCATSSVVMPSSTSAE